MSVDVTCAWRLAASFITLSTLMFGGCGGAKTTDTPRWSSGERPRWARFNPCPCLGSEALITSVELRPLNPTNPSEPPPPLGRWERVALRRPLTPEARALFSTLQARGEVPLTLLIDVSAVELESIESHKLRVAQLIALPNASEPPPAKLDAPAQALPAPPL